MKDTRKIVLLGAEKQAAISIAMAYPKEEFIFVSSESIICGWNLKNIAAVIANLNLYEEKKGDLKICLSSDWTHCLGDSHHCITENFKLYDILAFLNAQFPNHVLPVFENPTMLSGKDWIIKGDSTHKPDMVIVGNEKTADLTLESNTQRLVYQELIEHDTNIIVTGRRNEAKGIALGALKIHQEGFGREAFLLSGETFQNKLLLTLIEDMLVSLDYVGFFTFNVIKQDSKFLITSFRPILRAACKTLLSSGVDLINFDDCSRKWADSGKKFITEVDYNEFQYLTK